MADGHGRRARARGAGDRPAPTDFCHRLAGLTPPFLVLTNNSIYTRRDLAARLAGERVSRCRRARSGPPHSPPRRFLEGPASGGSAFVIGEAGVSTALHAAGYTLTDPHPDYVVLGRPAPTPSRRITPGDPPDRAGSPLHRHQPGRNGPRPKGPLPATRGRRGAHQPRRRAVEPYFVGKPNPLMMRSGPKRDRRPSDSSAMIGDRMDTDIVSGLEAGMETILVLTV